MRRTPGLKTRPTYNSNPEGSLDDHVDTVAMASTPVGSRRGARGSRSGAAAERTAGASAVHAPIQRGPGCSADLRWVVQESGWHIRDALRLSEQELHRRAVSSDRTEQHL